ncbi:urease accessory protein UreF [Waterburya agarophytonicola K14]|uniref:Urease accessory protein UreF n=1 Tax=Waterburya agarophytonicola KI4 TaxID=2874699 RepID=A0A964FDX5_9CYAN|nr:urease accessory UreF family protein [Waterburya agarophytonicola]MCC0176080.1 urease accessory protein UreF [Waterburya agarophytonicola KI4]
MATNDLKSTIKQKLTLMQLSDSFFPSGSYTLSHGLESLVQQDRIQQPEDLIAFLRILLHNKIGSCDLIALIHSYKGSAANDLARVRQVDARLFAQNAIAINRQTQRQSGRALLMVARSTWHNEQLENLSRDLIYDNFNCLHPIVFGVVGNIADLSLMDTALAFLHGFITGLLGAAIRLGILGHLQAQQISLELADDIEAVLEKSSSLDLDRMWSCTPTIDLAQMVHSQLNTRLFAS